MPDSSVDLVIGSPPYEDARTYGIGFSLSGQAWVDWLVERWREFARVSRGLVVMVVEGRTRNYRWSATPALLMADMHRAGLHLRKPPIYRRVGIPGSGGPDYFRNDYEFCVVTARPGRLAWSDNTACGHPPKWAPGGAPSHQSREGRVAKKAYKPPTKANPGNVIECKAGGGNMGSRIAHENEAPFPEALVERFVLSFAPPGGMVLDPFMGSGTTAAVCVRHGRQWIGIDTRESQAALVERRVKEASERNGAA